MGEGIARTISAYTSGKVGCARKAKAMSGSALNRPAGEAVLDLDSAPPPSLPPVVAEWPLSSAHATARFTHGV